MFAKRTINVTILCVVSLLCVGQAQKIALSYIQSSNNRGKGLAKLWQKFHST